MYEEIGSGHISMSFLRLLRKRLGPNIPFELDYAYYIYRKEFKHWIWDDKAGKYVFRLWTRKEIKERAKPPQSLFYGYGSTWYWQDAAVRTYLGLAVRRNVMHLKRQKRGVYYFEQ
jgi:hypothetical protein